MKRKFIINSIGAKLIFVIAISFIVSIVFFMISAVFIVMPYIYSGNLNAQYYNIMTVSIFISSVALFIVCFLLLINKKIKYIKYISHQVNKIANEELGSTLKVKGNDELSDLCKSINSMSLELKDKFEHEREIENIKAELITNVSHDLRTPLTAIIGYLDILKNKKWNTKEEENEYLASTYNLSMKLKKLIDELFEYTKLSNNDIALEFVEIDLRNILTQMIGEYITVLESKQLGVITHITDTELPVKIDVEKIVRVFENLLNNAEKYSVKPSNIIIKADKTADNVLISISNKSEHIEKDKLNKIFDKFFRVDASRASNIEGSGLGLAISKKIVELHKGEIWAECDENIIIIYVKLPISYKDDMKI